MSGMSDNEHRQVLRELESLLRETSEMLQRFVETGMDEQLNENYQKLLSIQAEALREQQIYLDALSRDLPERLH